MDDGWLGWAFFCWLDGYWVIIGGREDRLGYMESWDLED